MRFVNTPIQQVEVGRLGDCTLMMTSSPFACLAQLTLLQGDSIARVIAHYKLTANHLARTGAKINWIPLMQSLYACRPRSKNKNSQLLCFSFFFPVRASALLYWSQSNLMEETRRGGRMLAVFPISQKAFRLRALSRSL